MDTINDNLFLFLMNTIVYTLELQKTYLLFSFLFSNSALLCDKIVSKCPIAVLLIESVLCVHKDRQKYLKQKIICS